MFLNISNILILMGVYPVFRLSGYPPFFSGDDNQILEMTLQGIFYFPSPDWDPVSEQGIRYNITFINSLY